jgi:hypothetical protein
MDALILQSTPRWTRELDMVRSGGAGRGRGAPPPGRSQGRRRNGFASSPFFLFTSKRYLGRVGSGGGLGLVGGLLLGLVAVQVS